MKRAYKDNKAPTAEVLDLKARLCLMCRKMFTSEWSGERVCRRCKSTETWRRG